MAKVTIKLRRATSDLWDLENPILGDGEIGIDQSIGSFKIGDGVSSWTELPYAVLKGDPGLDGEDGWAPRESVLFTTDSLLYKETENATLTLQPGYRLIKIETDIPARIRVYDSVEKRDADALRQIGLDPKGPHGVILDFVTTVDNLSWWINPIVDGYTVDGSQSVPIAVTNLGADMSNVTLQLIWVRSE